jgi:hypothetical protein
MLFKSPLGCVSRSHMASFMSQHYGELSLNVKM